MVVMEFYDEDFETLNELKQGHTRPRLGLMLSRKRLDRWELDVFMNGQ